MWTQPLVTSSLVVQAIITAPPQSSWAWTLEALRSQAGIVLGLQPMLILVGHLVNVGGVVSTNRIFCRQLVKLPQPSLAFQSRSMPGLRTQGGLAGTGVSKR